MKFFNSRLGRNGNHSYKGRLMRSRLQSINLNGNSMLYNEFPLTVLSSINTAIDDATYRNLHSFVHSGKNEMPSVLNTVYEGNTVVYIDYDLHIYVNSASIYTFQKNKKSLLLNTTNLFPVFLPTQLRGLYLYSGGGTIYKMHEGNLELLCMTTVGINLVTKFLSMTALEYDVANHLIEDNLDDIKMYVTKGLGKKEQAIVDLFLKEGIPDLDIDVIYTRNIIEKLGYRSCSFNLPMTTIDDIANMNTNLYGMLENSSIFVR